MIKKIDLSTYEPILGGQIQFTSKDSEDLNILLKKYQHLKLHYCHEWDGALIDQNDPEFEACLCFKKKKKRFI